MIQILHPLSECISTWTSLLCNLPPTHTHTLCTGTACKSIYSQTAVVSAERLEADCVSGPAGLSCSGPEKRGQTSDTEGRASSYFKIAVGFLRWTEGGDTTILQSESRRPEALQRKWSAEKYSWSDKQPHCPHFVFWVLKHDDFIR